MTEERTRIHTRISPETEQKMKANMPLANCRSQNEFVEEAIRFYCDHLTSQDSTSTLAPMLVEALRGTVHDSENRIARLLFKQAVELDMMMNVLAWGMEIDEETLDQLRGRCVREVKQTNGGITFKDAVRYQNGDADAE